MMRTGDSPDRGECTTGGQTAAKKTASPADGGRYGVSDATVRNWKRLNTEPAGRLTSRANKRKSTKRIFPFEYMSNRASIAQVQTLLDYIDGHEIPAMSAILSLGISLLKREGLYGRRHVAEALREYEGTAVVGDLANACLPGGEFDILGLIYQLLLKEGKKNTTGSYYTPPKVARNMTKDFDCSGGQSGPDIRDR